VWRGGLVFRGRRSHKLSRPKSHHAVIRIRSALSWARVAVGVALGSGGLPIHSSLSPIGEFESEERECRISDVHITSLMHCLPTQSGWDGIGMRGGSTARGMHNTAITHHASTITTCYLYNFALMHHFCSRPQTHTVCLTSASSVDLPVRSVHMFGSVRPPNNSK
jgi:hypothetical protein